MKLIAAIGILCSLTSVAAVGQTGVTAFENLFNGKYRSAQFDTVSRLPNEPTVGAAVPPGFNCGRAGRLAAAPDGSAPGDTFYGCEEVDYTPAYPITARVMATIFLD